MTDGGAGAFLSRLTAKLAAAGVPSMVVGSFASSFHGVPRSSQDLDLVIDPQAESLRRFLSDLPPEDYYADALAIGAGRRVGPTPKASIHEARGAGRVSDSSRRRDRD